MMKKFLLIGAISCVILSPAQISGPLESDINLFANSGNHYGNDNPNGGGNNGNPDGNNGGTNNGNGGTNTNNGGTNNGNGQNDLTGSGVTDTTTPTPTDTPTAPVAPIDDHLPVLIIVALGIITFKGKTNQKALVA